MFELLWGRFGVVGGLPLDGFRLLGLREGGEEGEGAEVLRLLEFCVLFYVVSSRFRWFSSLCRFRLFKLFKNAQVLVCCFRLFISGVFRLFRIGLNCVWSVWVV